MNIAYQVRDAFQPSASDGPNPRQFTPLFEAGATTNIPRSRTRVRGKSR
jgi:hypothetical protein